MEDVKDLIEKAMDLSPHGMMVVEGEQIKAVNWGAVILLDAGDAERIVGKRWRDFFADINVVQTTKKTKILTLKGEEREVRVLFSSLLHGGDEYMLIIFQEENSDDIEKIRQHILISLARKLNELQIFYDIGVLAREAKSVEGFMQRIVTLIPKMMQHPELAYAKILFRGKEYATDGAEGERKIREKIVINGIEEGYLEVGYIKEPPEYDEAEFLPEEEKAVKEVAIKIGNMVSLTEMREEMERSRMYFQTILEKSSDITMVVDENAVIKFITPSIKEVLGFQPEEVIGKSALSFIHLEDMDACIWQHRKMLENPSRAIRAMYRIQTKEGEWKFVEIVGRNMLDDPAINGLIFNFHDITERVMVEKKLEENERKLRSILDATHDMVLLASVDETDFGKILEINDAMAESLGKSKSELKGTNIKEHLPADVYEKRTAKVFEVMKTGMPVEFEDTRAGKWFHNVFYPIFDYDGKVKQIAIFTRDITLEKKMMEELERSRIYFQTLLEKGWDVVMVHDENAEIKYVTSSVEKIMGYSPDEVIGRSTLEFVHPEDVDIAMNALKNMLFQPSEAFHDFLRVKNARGEWRTVEINARNLLHDPIVRGIVINYRDVTEEKEMENLLKESEKRFREVMENANEWVWEVNTEGLYTYSNSAVKKILGYSPEEVVGKKHFYDFFHPENREELKEKAFEIFREKKPFVDFLNRNMHRNGEERWLLTSGVPILDGDGNLVGYRGVDMDITAIKAAEERIKELNQYLEALINNANIWINTLDTEGNVILWNRAAEAISGYTMEEVVGHNRIWEWLYPDEEYRNKILNKARDIIEGREKVEDFETTIVTKDGRERVISWYSKNIVVDDTIIGSVAVGMDVTEKKMMEREMKKFKRIADTAQYGVIILNDRGKITYINEYFASLHGYKPEELIGKSLGNIVPEKSVKQIPDARKRFLEKGYLEPMEVFHKRRDGSIFPVLVAGSLIREEKNVYFALTYMDLTEKKKMEEMIKEKEKLAALGRLAAVIAHEINTPLSNIAVTAEYLASISEEKEEMEIIRREVDNIASIVRDILNFSRKEIREMTEFDLKEVMDEAIEKVRRTCYMEGVIIQNRMNPCIFRGDRQRIMECFVNIVKNAVLAREEGKKGHYVIVECEEGEKIKIMVRDNGTGMSKDVLKNAMKPFFSTRPAGEGSGLGLFISKWIVEAHKGRMEIESEPGKGTEVRIILPGGGE